VEELSLDATYSQRVFIYTAGGEILDDRTLSNSEDILNLLFTYLRTIGLNALDMDATGRHLVSARILKRILRLFRKAATTASLVARRMANVPEELLNLLEYSESHAKGTSISKELVEFLADEAAPGDILNTLSNWAVLSDAKLDVVPILHTILRRGAHASMSSELSGSLLSLKRARLRLSEHDSDETTDAIFSTDDNEAKDESIWKKMSSGMVAVAK
jgi:hypothetical protein